MKALNEIQRAVEKELDKKIWEGIKSWGRKSASTPDDQKADGKK